MRARFEEKIISAGTTFSHTSIRFVPTTDLAKRVNSYASSFVPRDPPKNAIDLSPKISLAFW